jgi:DNA-binding response OmpR family regulator
VEDDDAIRALLFTVLRRRGFQIDTSSNGADAIERLEHCVYCVVLLDLMMPVMSGYEFLADLEARKDEQRPLVIVLTAGAPPRDLNPEIVAGTIRKPFDIEMLVDTVAACLSSLQDTTQIDSCPAADSEASDRKRLRNSTS